MHIVLANQWFPPESGWGGVALYNHTLAHALLGLGHQVTILASRTSSAVPACQCHGGLTIQRLLVHNPYRWRRLPGLGRFARPMQQLLYAARVDSALRRLHKAQPVQVVEFADVNAEGFFFARRPACPVVVRCHTPNFILRRYYTRRELPFDTALISACERALIRQAHALTAPSRDMAATIAQACPVRLEGFQVVPNPVALSAPTSAAAGTCLVLHVGRLERAKGVFTLAAAIPAVVAAVPAARFVFIGADRPSALGASTQAELEAQLCAAGVLDHVRFLGAVPQADLAGWYAQADLCVVTSELYESFSYTSAQALAAGKPVVATRIGGLPETVRDGVDGLLVPPGDHPALSMAVTCLARDPARRARMGRAGRERAAHEFDPRRVAERTLEVYEHARRAFARADRGV